MADNTQQNNGVSILDLLGKLIQGTSQGSQGFLTGASPVNQGQNAGNVLTQPIPGTQQPVSTIQHLIENHDKYGIDSIPHDEKGGGKITFKDTPIQDNSINSVQGLGTTGEITPQTGDKTQSKNGMQILHNILFGDTATNSPNTENPTIRREPGGLLGQFNPGSDTEQPGNIYKLLTLLAGAGGYKPTTETAQNAATLQKLLGQEPMQEGEKKKMLANAAFDTTKLTNEAITASATAFDKIYTTLSGPEKAGLWLGKVPKRLEAISTQLQAAASQQSASFEARGKAAKELKGSKSSGGSFKILKVH